MRIAITGGIGSGKSYVCQLMEQRGLRVYYCDVVAKRLMRESEDIRNGLIRLIGERAYVLKKENGHQVYKLNKAVVAEFLLASEENNKAINSIVHPAVAKDFLVSGCSWMECAILYESGFDRYVDKVVAVIAPYETRIERIMRRDDITREAAEEWVSRQMPQSEIEKRADFIIRNDGNEDVWSQMEDIIKQVSK